MLNDMTVLAPPPHPKTTFPSLPTMSSSSVNQVHIWSVVGGKGQRVIMYEAITMIYLTIPWPGHELIHLCARNHASKSLRFPCQTAGLETTAHKSSSILNGCKQVAQGSQYRGHNTGLQLY